MGVELSRVEPPEGWPFLRWDVEVVQRFLHFVKYDDSGSFRMTKWKMCEFTGTDCLQDIARLFTAFEEAETDETAVSGLHLAVALLLCNQSVPVEFKVSECFSLFDWSGEGFLSFYDLLCLLQACAQALSRCVQAVPREIARDELETLCQEAMVEEVASLEALAGWAHSNDYILGLLLRLSPYDSTALGKRPLALNDVEVAVPSGDAAGREDKQTRGKHDATGVDIQADDPGKILDSAGSIEEQGDGAAERPGTSPSSKPASPRKAEEQAAAEGLEAGKAGEADVKAEDTVAEAQQEEDQEEPPLKPPPSGRELRTAALAKYLHDTRQALQAQVKIEGMKQRLHMEPHGSLAPATLAATLERRWVRSMGAALPALQTSWTAPLPAVPFGYKASTEAMRLALSDWACVHYACAVSEARFETAYVAKVLSGIHYETTHGEAQAARSLAGQQLTSFVDDHRSSSGEDPAKARQAMEAELIGTEERELQAARALTAAESKCRPASQRLRRDMLRLEGVIAYLDGLLVTPEAPADVKQLRSRALGMRDSLQKELAELGELENTAIEARQGFLVAHAARWAISAAMSPANKDPWAALANAIQELQRGGAVETQDAGFNRTAADALEAAEPRLRRCEGALIAMRTLAQGGGLRFELCFHEAAQLRRGTQRMELAALLAALDGAKDELSAEPPPSLEARRPLQRSLRVYESLSDALAKAGTAEEVLDSEKLKQVLQTTAEQLADNGKKEKPKEASGESAAPVYDSQSEHRGDAGEEEGSAKGSEKDQEEVEVTGDGSPPAEDAGVEVVGGDGPEMGEGCHQVTRELRQRLRELRYKHRTSEAAKSLAEMLLPEGLPAGVNEVLQNMLKRANDDLDETEIRPEMVRHHMEKWSKHVEVALTECCPNAFTDSDAAESEAETLGNAAAQVHRALLDLYEEFHSAKGVLHLPVSKAAQDARVSTHTRILPIEPQPSLLITLPGSSATEADVDVFGCVSTARHMHAARAVGVLQALELIHATASGDVAAAPAAVADEAAEAEKASTLSEIDGLAHCCFLKAEARLFAATAEHRLKHVELEMRHIAEAPWRRALLRDELPSVRSSPAQSAPPMESESGGQPNALRDAGRPSSTGAENESEPVLESLKTVEAAESILMSFCASDVVHVLRECAQDPQLQPRWAVVEKLLKDLHEHAPSWMDLSEEARSAPPSLSPVSEWWREESTEVSDEKPCSRCIELAGLTWDRMQRLDLADAAFVVGGAQQASEALLQRYAAAFRAWVLAQHRLLVFDVLIRGAWDFTLLTEQLLDTRRFVEVAWRSELGRQQVGQFAVAQQTCLLNATNFLHPLSAGDVDHVNKEDLDEHARLIRSDLGLAIDECTASTLMEFRTVLNSGEQATLLLEGMQASLEHAGAVGSRPAALEAHLAECGEVMEKLATEGFKGARSQGTNAERITVECWGVLRALERLRCFCMVNAK